ncbi:MAG: hypothetical protein WAT39_05075 [Planctomycetota bacterium]
MDTYDFFADPRAIGLPERHAAMAAMPREQGFWLARLQQLAEPPRPERDFPAFLLSTPPFRELAHRLARASRRAELPIATADELDWFLRAFRDYLRTDAGEDAFSSSHRGSLEH